MNFKKSAFFVSVLLTITVLSCKKETTTVVTSVNDSVAQATIASDEVFVNAEIDQGIDEAVSCLGMCKSTSGSNTVSVVTVQGAIIDTSQVDSGIVNIFYYAKETDTNRQRSGTVKIKLPVVSKKVIPWVTVGVTAIVTFTTYEINYLNTNTSLWFTDSVRVINYSGGLQANLLPGDSLVEKVRGPINYTYNDNGAILQTYLWNLHKTRVLGVTSTSHVSVTTRGDTTVNGFNNISNWGVTRFMNPYYTVITKPVFQDITSSLYNGLSGSKIIQGISEPVTITLGVNQQGAPVSNVPPFGFLINWTNSSGAQQSVIGYQK